MYYGRRRHQRRTAFPLGASTLGKIFVGDSFIGICKLSDISDGGACILVDHPYDIPETFNLALGCLTVKRACRIVWRGQRQIGVAFQCAAHVEAEQKVDGALDNVGNQLR